MSFGTSIILLSWVTTIINFETDVQVNTFLDFLIHLVTHAIGFFSATLIRQEIIAKHFKRCFQNENPYTVW